MSWSFLYIYYIYMGFGSVYFLFKDSRFKLISNFINTGNNDDRIIACLDLFINMQMLMMNI